MSKPLWLDKLVCGVGSDGWRQSKLNEGMLWEVEDSGWSRAGLRDRSQSTWSRLMGRKVGCQSASRCSLAHGFSLSPSKQIHHSIASIWPAASRK